MLYAARKTYRVKLGNMSDAALGIQQARPSFSKGEWCSAVLCDYTSKKAEPFQSH